LHLIALKMVNANYINLSVVLLCPENTKLQLVRLKCPNYTTHGKHNWAITVFLSGYLTFNRDRPPD